MTDFFYLTFIVECIFHFFLLLNNSPLYGWTTFYSSIYHLMDIELFYLVVVMDNATMNIHV
jgi:hypothetical protein